MELTGEQLGLATALIDRGVNRDLAGIAAYWCEPAVIRSTIAWYDRERERREIGPGVLVDELKSGGRPPTLEERNAAYVAEIDDWIARHFPDLIGNYGRPHPKAWIAAWRIRARTRTWPLDPAEHEAEIRAAVERFEREISQPTPTGKGEADGNGDQGASERPKETAAHERA